MCYDISFTTTIETVLDYLPDLVPDPQIRLDYNTYEHVMAQAFRKYPVVLFEDGQYKMKLFEWGVIPEYMNTPEKIKKGRNSMCNARAEKIVEDKRSYWHRIRRHRCLIPVTGIFEHREVRGFKTKVPYLVRVKDRTVFFLPGLYHYPLQGDPETGEITGTFTLITRGANDIMSKIHNSGDNANRMPMFLTPESEKEWLSPALDDEGISRILHYELPSDDLDYSPVYTIRTTKERPDGRKKLEPFEWANLPPLGADSEATLF